MLQADLVARASRGDQDEFAALATAHTDRCYALAYRILRDPQRAEDAAQQALLGAWRDLPRLKDPERSEAWLHRRPAMLDGSSTSSRPVLTVGSGGAWTRSRRGT